MDSADREEWSLARSYGDERKNGRTAVNGRHRANDERPAVDHDNGHPRVVDGHNAADVLIDVIAMTLYNGVYCQRPISQWLGRAWERGLHVTI